MESIGGDGCSRQLIEDQLSTWRTGLNDKAVRDLARFFRGNFCKSDIVGGGVFVGSRESWPRVHRGAKAGARGGRALESDHEQVVAPPSVLGIDRWRGHKNAVLDRDGRQLACASTEDCQGLVWGAGRFVGQERVGWKKEFLPGVGSEVEVKVLLVFGALGCSLDLIDSWGLRVRPALRKLLDRGQFLVDDGILFDRRSHDAEAL